MDRQRVVFISGSAEEYGAENALLDLVRLLPDEFEPIVVLPETGPLLNTLTQSGIEYRIVPFAVLDRKFFHPLRIFVYKARALLSVIRLISLFRALKPSVVHTNNVLVLPGAIAAKIMGLPHVWHVREIIEGHHLSPALWKIWRWIIVATSNRVVCISSAVRAQFVEDPKVLVVHDGIDAETFCPIGTNRSRAPVGKEDLVIGTVGRIELRRKGQDLFIEAARMAMLSSDKLRFVIAGQERDSIAKTDRRIHDILSDGGLKEKIELRGFVSREHMPKLMNDFDVLVLCSKQPEGLGIVLLEAMACGRPVISFAEGGPLDIVIDHVNGLLTPPGDVTKLAEAILELAGDAELRATLGSNGRRSVIDSFQSQRTAETMAGIFRQILRTLSC